MLSTALLLVALVFLINTILKYWRTQSSPLPGIPYNAHNKWNFLGDILELIRADTPVDYFSQVVHKHGKICQVLLGPLGRLVLVADATEIEENLLKYSHNFDKAGAVRAAFCGTMTEGSVGLPANEQWKLHRRMMSPSMSPAHLSSKMNAIFANVHKLITIWSLKSKLAQNSDGTFECTDDIERFAMDTIVDILFGKNLNALESSYDYLNETATPGIHYNSGALKVDVPSPQHYTSFRILLKSMGMALRSGAARATYFGLNLTPSWRSARRDSRLFVDIKLKEYRQGDAEQRHTSFLDLLHVRFPSGRPDGVSLSALKDELITYIIGGADTSATVICWIIKYLVLNPRVQIRLHAELSASLKMSADFAVSYEELQGSNFPYLDAVVSESLRLANVGGVSARDALDDVVISGCRIPKGSQIFFLTGHVAINNAPPMEDSRDIDSRTFYPERWIERDENGREVFNSRRITSWPFGYGPRGCPGQRLAILELKAFVMMINLSFFLQETHGSVDSRAEMLVVLRKLSQTCVKLQRWDEIKAVDYPQPSNSLQQ